MLRRLWHRFWRSGCKFWLDDGNGRLERLERKYAGELVLKFMINRIVTVALGGFVLAKALNKALHGISFANLFIKYAGTREIVLLATFGADSCSNVLVSNDSS